MSFSSVYEPQKEEKKIYKLWEKSGLFNPDNLKKAKKSYCIIMPPTNANGNLHIGHALGMGIEDIMIRYHRLKGEKTLWLPGTDHAGFETQVVFEKHLEKEGKSRFDMKREDFYKAVWDFTQTNRKGIREQIKKLGASCDWSREKFTLDKDIIKIVYDTFKKLYADGLIYRGERIVNYCTKHRTAFSDLEVNHILRQDKLFYVRYEFKNELGKFITVATTRPETIPGDVAIAVNPKDERYKKLIGDYVIEPITQREIPIIADSLVEIEFGTGALKITPAHAADDFEIGQRHHLEIRKTLDTNGRFNELSGPLVGLKVNEAREKAIEILNQNNALEKIEDYEHQVGVCYKCGNVIEPMLMEQWFIALKKSIASKQNKSLSDLALSAIKTGQVKIFPKRFEKVYFHWLKNIHDWNISRQIWWGIPIPVYYCQEIKNEVCQKSKGIIISDKEIKKCPHCGSTNLVKDQDTFDTWFSSGQWPFATLKTQKNKKDFQAFYPTGTMETGYDILFFWVARMVMLGLYATDQVPFKDVYLHGLVRDQSHQKISKSKGNVIDPLDMITKYGSDALRIGLIINNAPGNDLVLSEDKIKGYRNFANKIWNASRFTRMNLGSDFQPKKFDIKYIKTPADKKIIKQLKDTIKKTTIMMDSYRFYQAGDVLYHFFWHKFCDQYIESAKKQMTDSKKIEATKQVLYHVLSQNLIMLHPFMPFVTEAVWQSFKNKKQSILMAQNWPKP